MELYTNQLQNYTMSVEKYRKHVKKVDGKSNVLYYNNSILTFDIEVSSAWLENGKVIPYRKGEDNEYWNNLQPLALCYIWQFSCDGIVYYGRELRDFLNVLNDIPKEQSTIIWVHNLSYEFHFLSNILHWKTVFARTPHKPMRCIPLEYPNIEFRCTYYLTQLSLDTWGKQLGVHKAVGDLDYDIIRTPLTPLTDKELHYCEQDCLVVESGVKSYLRRYGKLRKIPLTQTGTVRQVIKEILTKDPEYVKRIKKLVPFSYEEYNRLQTVFSGGYTHANKYYSGKLVEGLIEHYDFSSSYPTVLISEKMPMKPWIQVYNEIPDISCFEDYAYIFKITFNQLNSISFNTYIQACKCVGKKMRFDNGRVLSADELTITITEQDYLTILNNYTWESMTVLECYKSKKEYLPREFTDYILDLYANKTELKDVDGMEELYLQSKQYINSMYGMCVTALVQADVVYDNDEWSIKPLTKEIVEKKLNALADFNPREKRYFLSYSWGCWVTAYARRNLWKCIESVDKDVIYCDTDSIFVRNKQDFSWYNEEITEKIKKACEINGLDFNKTRPKTKKGKEKPLGIFTQEENCIQFKTLGAKRYVERREDNKLYLTVSGINKDAVAVLNDDIENFVDGLNFDKDDDSVKKRLSTYVNDMPIVKYDDGYISTYKKGINLRRTGYMLTIPDEYKMLMEFMNYTVYDLPETFINSMRGEILDGNEETIL